MNLNLLVLFIQSNYFLGFCCFLVFMLAIFEFILIMIARPLIWSFLKVKFPFGRSGAMLVEILKNGGWRTAPLKAVGDLKKTDTGEIVQDFVSKYKIGDVEKTKGKYHLHVTTTGLNHPSGVKLYFKREGELTTLDPSTFEPSELNQDSFANYIEKQINAKEALKKFLDKQKQGIPRGAIFAIIIIMFLVVTFAFMAYSFFT